MSAARAPRVPGHVLVVGAGGIGCPAAWALADAGVARLTIVDPDVVEPSNLPRQVLFGDGDVGRPKAAVAAKRLARPGVDVRGLVGRLDDTTSEAWLAGVDVLVDATDGARAKDWLGALAVRRRMPLIHAAGVGSEGRVFDVAPGGRPCLACLFGRLTEEGGTCADLGVWNGVVGVVGFLAAARALARLAQADAPTGGYQVLDLAGGRAPRFPVAPDARCPVCAAGAPRAPEPYPDPVACAATPASPTTAAPETPAPLQVLDLVEEQCPMNLLRARRAVEEAPTGAVLEILLGEEGSRTVPEGLARLGHRVLAQEPRGTGLRLRVRAGGRRASTLGDAALRRFARQVVLPDVGEAGQARWLASRVEVHGSGDALEVASVYLRAAGVGDVVVLPRDGDALEAVADLATWRAVADPRGIGISREGSAPAVAVPGAGPAAKVLGALLADAALRSLLAADVPPRAFAVGEDSVLVAQKPSRA